MTAPYDWPAEYVRVRKALDEAEVRAEAAEAKIVAALAWHGSDDSGLLCVCGDGVSPCRTVRALTEPAERPMQD